LNEAWFIVRGRIGELEPDLPFADSLGDKVLFHKEVPEGLNGSENRSHCRDIHTRSCSMNASKSFLVISSRLFPKPWQKAGKKTTDVKELESVLGLWFKHHLWRM
jgi:hypothetical protein